MPRGGHSWDTATTASLWTNTPSPITDYDVGRGWDIGDGYPHFAAWWKFTAAKNGKYTFDLNSSGLPDYWLDTRIYVFSGPSLTERVELVSDDDGGLMGRSQTRQINLSKGQTCRIVVGLYDSDTYYTPGSDYILNIAYAPATKFESAITYVGYQGGLTATAWDGSRQHLYTSVTNNCRYFALQTEAGKGITQYGGNGAWGWTQTTTSNNDYPAHLNFVQPGIVPITNHWRRAGSPDSYELSTLKVEGGLVTRLENRTFPSQNFSSSGFLRGQFSLPDNPRVYWYGTSGGGANGECWMTDIGPDGSITEPVSLGPVTFNGAVFSDTSAKYSALNSNLQAFSDRRGINHFGIMVDRLNPTVFQQLSLPPPSGFSFTSERYWAEPRVAPDHIYVSRQSTEGAYGSRTHIISDTFVGYEGPYISVSGEWQTPEPCFGVSVTASQKHGVIALCDYQQPSWDVPMPPRRAFLDIFGTPKEVDVVLQPGYYTGSQAASSGDDGFILQIDDALEYVGLGLYLPPPVTLPPSGFLLGYWDGRTIQPLDAEEN